MIDPSPAAVELVHIAVLLEAAARRLRALAAPPVIVICAWCPDFDPTDPRNQGATHGICPTCQTKFEHGVLPDARD
jgi:hypothetical protein